MSEPRFFRFIAALATLILSLSSAGAATDADVVRENALLSAAQLASGRDDLIGVQAIESKALAVDAGAIRQGDSLILHLSTGATATYKDRPECKTENQEARCQKYSLVVHARARGVFVVAKLYYESAEFVLIDDTSGSETVLRQFPVFSPSGKHILVLLMNDEVLGFAIQIWRRDGHRFVADWSGSPHANGMYTSYKLVRWLSEDTIELQSETSFEPPKPNLLKGFSLRRSTDGWKVVEK